MNKAKQEKQKTLSIRQTVYIMAFALFVLHFIFACLLARKVLEPIDIFLGVPFISVAEEFYSAHATVIMCFIIFGLFVLLAIACPTIVEIIKSLSSY